MSDAVEKMKALERRVLARPVQLPIWPDKKRGLPNPIARCALFKVGREEKDEDRRHMQRELIPGSDPALVHWTGKELYQSDMDVFLQILHIGRRFELGDTFIVTGREILDGLQKKSRSTDAYHRLRESVNRMAEGTLWVTQEGKLNGFSGWLIRKVNWAKQNEKDRYMRWMFELDKDIAPLFADDMYSHIDWEQRLQLSPMAKWLHAFYHTHKVPNPMPAARIKELCGSETEEMYHFRQAVRRACAELEKVNFIRPGWKLEKDDNLYLERTRTGQVVDMPEVESQKTLTP